MSERQGSTEDAATHVQNRGRLIERLRPFCEDSAAMWLVGWFDDADTWPEGAELNDVFPADGEDDEYEPMHPMSTIGLWDVEHGRAPGQLAELLHTALAYNVSLPPDRVAEAERLAADVVEFFGPAATWRISREDWQSDPHGGRGRVFSAVTEDTFSLLMIGRNDRDVLVLVAADED